MPKTAERSMLAATPRPPGDVIQYASGYTLDLYCDHSSPRHGWGEFPHQYTGETFGECARRARRVGWIIRTEARTATCPKCSEKRRSTPPPTSSGEK